MRVPVVMVGDGALRLWRALEEVFPTTRHQRDWVHKLANVLACLPKAVPAGVRKAPAEIRDAPDRDSAERAIEAVARDDGVKWPKAVAKITADAEELLCFLYFPRRALAAPEDQQPNRVHLRHRPATNHGNQGPRLQGRGAGRWPSSCWRPPRTAGGPSTARTWSRWCAPAPASRGGVLVERPAEPSEQAA
jgi:Transposase, Mutator family